MRHGESKANLIKKIISDPRNGILPEFSLSDLGKIQAKESAEKTKLPSSAKIFHSDFSRAVETAQIVAQVFESPFLYPTESLRERFFGQFEGTSIDNYQTVWKADLNCGELGSVEPAQHVFNRVKQLIESIESNFSNETILLVSHGDTLQILQTYFENVPPCQHRSLPHLNTAEIRKMKT